MYSYNKGPYSYSSTRTHQGYGYYPNSIYRPHTVISKAQLDLNNQMRLLWEQHVVWTRLTIISIAFDLPDVDFNINRLLRNPKDLAALLRPFYGDRIASRADELFTSHLVIAAELVRAAKAGDTQAVADAEKRWYANADEIALFLCSINPYWSVRQWRSMLHEHLALTKAEAVSILSGEYEEGIALFDQIEKQALDMADVMTNGIVRQFLNDFM